LWFTKNKPVAPLKKSFTDIAISPNFQPTRLGGKLVGKTCSLLLLPCGARAPRGRGTRPKPRADYGKKWQKGPKKSCTPNFKSKKISFVPSENKQHPIPPIGPNRHKKKNRRVLHAPLLQRPQPGPRPPCQISIVRKGKKIPNFLSPPLRGKSSAIQMSFVSKSSFWEKSFCLVKHRALAGATQSHPTWRLSNPPKNKRR